MNEQEQRFLGLMEQHRQIIYKVCFMYASDDETISVSDVCFSLGFENLAHFSQLFKRRFGVSPSEI